MRQLLFFLAVASSAANVKELPPKMSGEETTWEPETSDPWIEDTTTRWPEDPTTPWPEDPTTPWPEDPTTHPWTEDPTTTEDFDTTTSSGATCPLGWIDDGKLGCFLFAPQMTGLSWIEALEYCEEQVHILAVNLE